MCKIFKPDCSKILFHAVLSSFICVLLSRLRNTHGDNVFIGKQLFKILRVCPISGICTRSQFLASGVFHSLIEKYRSSQRILITFLQRTHGYKHSKKKSLMSLLSYDSNTSINFPSSSFNINQSHFCFLNLCILVAGFIHSLLQFIILL
jgi:hypothetical protein